MTDVDRTALPLWRITVSPRRDDLDARGVAMLRDIHELGLPHIRQVATSRLFLIEGDLSENDVERIAGELLADPVTETFLLSRECSNGAAAGTNGFNASVEVHLKGGVMDPVAASTLAALADMGFNTDDLAVSTARIYRLAGAANPDEVELIAKRLLFNDCIEDVYVTAFDRHDQHPEHLPTAPEREFELRRIPILDLDDEELKKLSRDAHLFLSLEEMRAIQKHYQDQGREPTDLELEMFAQTWSEHCVHKTLKSNVRYIGAPLPGFSQVKQNTVGADRVEIVYDNLLADTVARATHELIDIGQVDWCLSVFVDNAGVIVFDDEFGLAFKVETHNHPSAIEPYGGAATGIGGCIRDVLGCGLGAKPIANTDVFCVGQPDFPMDTLPKGVLHPRRILKGVVSGVRDYGNRMGIPTVNGGVVFDDRYLGNPLVFCGCLGLIPNNCVDKEPKPGDLIVVIGGRTGRDGIHGATFSSAELTDTHADEFSHAVQIGNAITEKQVLDAMMLARDHDRGCLYNATTDCGAGGLSSAVGEMGETLGATVELEKVPLKYAGLRYDEIWISEAQERMVFSVPPSNWKAFKAICDAEAVEATVIGEFRDDGRLDIRYDGRTVGDIDAHFLHNGVPNTEKEATWQPPEAVPVVDEQRDPKARLLSRLAELNTASKEWIFRQYDHEVQGGSVVKPLTGPGEGPSDAAVVRPRPGSDKAVALSNGLCTTEADPYWLAVAGIDEAIRNAVCVGGNPARTAILDNFCWGNCEDAETMGALARACQGCYDAATTYGTPFISGKDSLNNEFALDASDARRLAERVRLAGSRIRIPETLLISAISLIEDVHKCVTMDAKSADSTTHFMFVGLPAERWSDVDLEEAADLHMAVAELIRNGKVLAAHDCGAEGILPALAEMAFGGRCGVNAVFDGLCPFKPVPTGYLLQVTEANRSIVEGLIDHYGVLLIRPVATSTGGQELTCTVAKCEPFSVSLDELDEAWRSPLAW